MIDHDPEIVDTSKNSTDHRIGPDGKITEEQGEYLKSKAINNIAESLVKRATDLGGKLVINDKDSDIAEFHVHEENDAGVTGLTTNRLDNETGRDISTVTTINAPGDPGDTTTILRRTTSKDNLHREAYADHVDVNGKLNGRVNGSTFNDEGGDHRSLSSKETARTAIDVINEQRDILAAAKRVIDRQEDQPDKAA